MGPPKPLYRVRVSSSGLIYAVIVGAWAAYLVPMWLRRQDELNEARPTERFSTAIRLLSGKAGMERRYAKEAERREGEVPSGHEGFAAVGDHAPGDRASGNQAAEDDDAGGNAPDTATDAVDVRAFADPKTMVGAFLGDDVTEEGATEILPRPDTEAPERPRPHAGVQQTADAPAGGAARAEGAGSELGAGAARRDGKRAKVLARRRRTTMLLFVAFTVGAIVAAVGGVAFLWAPAAPGALLSAYIVYLRVQERRRFAVVMDRRRAEAAARRLHEQRRQRPSPPTDEEDPDGPGQDAERPPGPFPAPPEEQPGAASRRALVEQTDHAEWVDQQRARERERPEGEGWEPVPVPLPTYVSAPVAPRTTRGVDLEAPDAWSSARSSAADGGRTPRQPSSGDGPATGSRRTREHGRTPLFDQYEDEERPRAANE